MKSTNLREIAERFISTQGEGRQGVLESLVRELKAALASARLSDAGTCIRLTLLPDLDYSSALALVRSFRLLEEAGGKEDSRTRIAVVGGYNVSTLIPLIELYLFGAGIRSEVYESPFGVFRQEIHDARSPLYAFEPKIVLLATGWRDLLYKPAVGDDSGTVQRRLKDETDDWARLWEALHDRLGCAVIQNGFDSPPWRVLDNHDSRHRAGLSRYICSLNLAIQDRAPVYVIVHDVGRLAAQEGLSSWGDPRFYHYAKLPCAPQYLPEYAHSVASLISALAGRSRKCLVLDLDNTLWGGVVGEDGIEGIRLGQGDPEGEAFAAFQRYVKELRDRGILLAACSKNEDAVARQVFTKHPGTVLRLSDFSCFLANWNDKVSNLRTIAEKLNIGLDSLVFVDDEPAERTLVRGALPQVAVPEMPDDPADYIVSLEKHRFFQLVSLATEDLKRAEYYRTDASRTTAASLAENLDDFLTSLNMTARVAPISALTLERSAQLVNKSNQFNLTTRRCSAAEMRTHVENPDWVTLAVSLSDRFGDNGLISVLMARIKEGDLWIDIWVMSCRVLKRSVEHFLLNVLCSVARDKGLKAIHGEFIPTQRNEIVRDHYREMGFDRAGDAEEGHTLWTLHLDENKPPLPTFVKEEICSE